MSMQNEYMGGPRIGLNITQNQNLDLQNNRSTNLSAQNQNLDQLTLVGVMIHYPIIFIFTLLN